MARRVTTGTKKKAAAATAERIERGALADTQATVVFCDIGDVLGTPVFSPPPPTLKGLDVFPFVRQTLEQLRERNLRLGIISNTGDETADNMNRVLRAAGLLTLFESGLLIYSSVVGFTKEQPEIFRLAAEQAGVAPEQCLFVGEDPRERSVAVQVGMRVARDLSRLESVLQAVAFVPPDISNLDQCIEDVRRAALDSDPGPEDVVDFDALLTRLEGSRERLPPIYRESVFEPFVATLRAIGPTGFNRVLLDDPERISAGGLMIDISHAILQNGERFEDKATDAFEEVVSDLYDGFLSAQDRRGIKAPDHIVLAPLVKWGNPDFGPYTWPIDATMEAFDVGAAIVNLPPSNARRGLAAWAALGHETAGHDILHADEGLQAQLAAAVQTKLEAANIGFGFPEYWASRIDETASDVLGILNMGPAAGIGLIAFFRGLSAAAGRPAKLRSTGPASDPHPADILRGYLAAATIRLLSFDGAAQWGNLVEAETDRDLAPIRLAGILVSQEVAKKSAEIVAGAIAATKMSVLGNHALIDIQDWRNRDEEIVQKLQTVLTTTTPLSIELAAGTFAAHVVSATVTAGLSAGANIDVLFSRMVTVLKAMHDKNPSWGPLFVAHPSTISRHVTFQRPIASENAA
jgi:phosphoglycolate phosphatase-like HAD superfamily hydrolase